MLVPHRRENAELGERRGAADEREDARVFLWLQAMCGGDFGSDVWFSGSLQGTSGWRDSNVSTSRLLADRVQLVNSRRYFGETGILSG
jgi:hypothetical protein